MKSLHVIPSISLARGGPSHVVIGVVKALRDRGVDAQIITTNDDGPRLTLSVPLNEQVTYEGVPVRFFPKQSSYSSAFKFSAEDTFLFSAEMTRWLWQNLRQYDIVETRYLFSYPSAAARLICQLQQIPYTVDPIGQLCPWALAQGQLKKKIYSILIERRNLAKAAAIQCSSRREAQDVCHLKIKSPTFIAPIGVEIPGHRSGAKQALRKLYQLAEDTSIILFFSRLHYKKRPDILIQSLSSLAVTEASFHLVLAGSGDSGYVDHLKHLVSSLGLADRITFAGFVTGTEKEMLLQGSDIFVLPSFSENFGIAVVEAMAASLPVVITPDVYISGEIAAAEAGLVVPGEVPQLSEAIASLLASPDLRDRLGKSGRRLVEKQYTWPAIARYLVSVYESIIAQKELPQPFSADAKF
ncbi:MAG: glycosyltransferase [Leptolyngbya sp. SIO4C5]|nr:glycosyltransferase [Leptolyngbya sp. SIO4C5]